MSDRELLELAAKAAGISLTRWNQMYACYESTAGMWNPLIDDGDALRMAVKLGLNVEQHKKGAVAWYGYIGSGFFPYGDDPNAATRRAITTIAATIGMD